jgi:hypothetical protein
MRRWICASVLVLACESKDPSPESAPRPAELEPIPAHHPSLEPLPDPELQGGHVGRAPRRITVAQLASSIEVTTGRKWAQLDSLAASLGRADYALVNAEATETNLVFAKFLEDGARQVCLEAADADLKQTDVSKRVLSPAMPADADLAAVDAAQTRANLVYLSTRFWGEPLHEPELTQWSDSFKNIASRAKTAKKPREAWGAICIAMITDPRFLTY